MPKMPDLPKFHGKGGSRTRPSRRRPDPIVLTPHEATRQRSLSKAFLVIGTLVALLSLSAAGITQFARDDSQGAAPPHAAVVSVPGAVLVDVVKVIDGDTLDVRAAQTELRIRLYGVDTPERGDRCSDEATDRLRSLAGSQVQLVSDARQRDRYDRELRYAFTAAGESIDAMLIGEGLAVAWREDGAQRASLIAIEDQARSTRAGCLWSGS